MRRLLATLLAATVCASACSGDERPPPPSSFGGSGGESGSGGSLFEAGLEDGPPPADAEVCGNLVVPVVVDKPNLYFVLDRSGSMAGRDLGNTLTKYENARVALAEVLRSIGHRVRVGAAVFPRQNGTCSTGEEVFPTTDGDPASFAAQGEDGPVLTGLLSTLAALSPNGGTPTSSTLDSLRDPLVNLEGRTFVVLMTDGAPNCNPLQSCPIERCQPNIEKVNIGAIACDDQTNCCDPTLLQNAQLNCVDDQPSIDAVSALRSAGISTYVVGMPGSQFYSNLLDDLAVAGGTGRTVVPKYYAVDNVEELVGALTEIGTAVAISCTVDLDEPPPDPNMVNVYFDVKLVKSDALDGWTWVDEDTLEIRGAACDELKSGNVLQLQVVSGCPTEAR